MAKNNDRPAERHANLGILKQNSEDLLKQNSEDLRQRARRARQQSREYFERTKAIVRGMPTPRRRRKRT